MRGPFSLPAEARAQGGRPTIRLGYLDSLSGPFAVGGIPQLNGARLALEDANRRGRARYELVVADDTTKPAVGTTEARRLVENEKVRRAARRSATPFRRTRRTRAFSSSRLVRTTPR
jgi:ABC-type branched-subunit amino acid transport system substrate-binding protein